MTDWLNRLKGLRMFEDVDKRAKAMEKRVRDLESALGELSLDLRKAVAKLRPDPDRFIKAPPADQGIPVEEKDGRIVLATEPASIPARPRDDPEAVHLLQGLQRVGPPTGQEEEAGMWCGLSMVSAAHWGTVGQETTCEACMQAWAAAVRTRDRQPKAQDPDGTV